MDSEREESPKAKKLNVKEMRSEIGLHKAKLVKNLAVMKADELRKYLDKMRYISNAVEAEDVLSMADEGKKKHAKPEHKEPKDKKKEKVREHETDSEEESSSEEEEKKIVKKVEKKVEKVKKEIDREKHLKPKEVAKEHKAEKKHLDEIPKELHKMVKKQMKEDGHDDAKKAYRAVLKKLK